MRHAQGTTWLMLGRLLVALLLPIAMACGEGKFALPTYSALPPEFGFIYLADSSGKVQGRLTEGGWPSWSPDGRRILFERNGHVLVIDADGSNEIDLATGSWPTWSPDGGRIAFVANRSINVMNADGSAARTLLSPTLVALHYGVGKPSWSPDGALIAFDEPPAYIDGFAARIFVMSADGASQYVLGGYAQYESEPSWSPDGARVVYCSSDMGLAIAPRGGGLPVQLINDQPVMLSARPAWSPDGRAILFNGWSRDGRSFDFNDRSPSSVMTISPEGGPARALIDRGADASWSPDGTRIAFMRREPR